MINRVVFLWVFVWFSLINQIFASEFYEQLTKAETLSSFLMCGRPFMNASPRMYTDSFENHFDWVCRNSGVVLKKKLKPESIWWRIDQINTLVKKLRFINPKIIWLAGNDRPHLSKLNKRVIDKLIKSGAKIFYESKDIDSEFFHTAPVGFQNGYLPMFERNDIHEAVLCSEEFFHNKKGVLAAWGAVWKNLDTRIEDRKNAHKFALNADFVDRRSIDRNNWWKELASYRFMLAPLGNGISTPKIFEALLVQTIPILINVPLNRDLKNYGLPVVIVDDWNEITEEKLEIWWKELSPKLEEARWMLTDKWWKDSIFNNYLSEGEDPSSIFINSEDPQYTNLKTLLPFDDHGYYNNAAPMERLIKKEKAKIMVEVGSWLGKSSRHIASQLPRKGKLYCIDHWKGSDDMKPFLKEKYDEHLYEHFLSNIIHAKLTHKVIPIRMNSIDGAKELQKRGVSPDIIYIDACHWEDEVYADLEAYFPLVKGHGVLCGDDWNWRDKPVKKAVTRFAKEYNLKIEVADNNWFWILREKNLNKD